MRIVDRLVDAGAKLGDAPGQAGQSPLTLHPVARRQVEQRLGRAVRVEARGDLGGGKVVGADIFDATKTELRRGLETTEKRPLGEQHREIGGKLRRDGSFALENVSE